MRATLRSVCGFGDCATSSVYREALCETRCVDEEMRFRLAQGAKLRSCKIPSDLRVLSVSAANSSFLRLAAAGAGLPRIPVAEQLQLLIEAGFFHQHVELRARQAFAERLGAVSDAPGGKRGERSVELELADVHFIQGVGSGVIIRQGGGLFLVGPQAGNALQGKNKIVSSKRRGVSVGVGVPGI